MSKINGAATQRTHHHPEPDANGAGEAAHAGKADAGKAASAKTAAPVEHMSKSQRAAVDGLVQRHSLKNRFEATRTVLTKNPGLADHYVAQRLRGRSKVDHQIVHAVLARSGTTGMQRLAMCESALRQIAPLGASQRADVMALVKTGSSLHAAVAQLQADARADKAEATAKSQPSMAHKVDAAVKSLKREAAEWKKTSEEVNALYREVPVMTRTAEAATGFFGATATVGDMAVGALRSAATLNGHHFSEAVDKAERAGGYMFGELNDKVDEARTLHTQFSKEHIAYVEQSNRMQRAIRSGDFRTQMDAKARMDKLAGAMKETVARFRPTAEKAIKMDRQFNKDTKEAVEHVLTTAATLGAEGPFEGIKSAGKAVYEGLEGSVTDAALTQAVDMGVDIAHEGVSSSD